MKKVSTVRAKQSKNFSGQKLTIGLDLGDRSSWYSVLDERGEIVLEQRLGTTPKAMQEGFGSMPRSRIALEAGMHSPWVSRVLSGLGYEVIVAHARSVRLIGESRKKDDRLDAQTLARLARMDPQLLCPVKHRSAKAQADLTVIRARAGLVRARTALVNTARGLAKSYGERLRGCNVRNMNPEKAEGLSPELQRALEPLSSKPGWTICGEATNGEEGIQKAQQLKPDAIILDISMPQLDGMETAGILQRLMPTVPLIMFTNFAKDQFLKREVLWAGIRQVVSKSDSLELVQALEAAFAA